MGHLPVNLVTGRLRQEGGGRVWGCRVRLHFTNKQNPTAPTIERTVFITLLQHLLPPALDHTVCDKKKKQKWGPWKPVESSASAFRL